MTITLVSFFDSQAQDFIEVANLSFDSFCLFFRLDYVYQTNNEYIGGISMTSKQERLDIFKVFQTNIKKSSSFDTGKQSLLALRKELSEIYDYIFTTCDNDDFCKMPFSNNKTIAYYLYHLTRIEDITSNTLIAGRTQLFFAKNFDKLLNSPIITTGNEITRDELIGFSKSLDINQLRNYASVVLDNTNSIIQDMSFEDSRIKVSTERKNDLLKLNTVSTDENAFWLVDYWCRKTYSGLLLMPFSKHQMLHLDSCLRIVNKIKK